MRYGPGTHFEMLLARVMVTLSDDGKKLVSRMNHAGLTWCEQHHKEILADFAKAEKAGTIYLAAAKFVLCAALRNARYARKSK